jgi:hypothetical protein
MYLLAGLTAILIVGMLSLNNLPGWHRIASKKVEETKDKS